MNERHSTPEMCVHHRRMIKVRHRCWCGETHPTTVVACDHTCPPRPKKGATR